MTDGAPLLLTSGRFFGARRRAATTPSFTFCEMDATVAARQVPRHTHDAPHFILVVAGPYATAARNQDGPCAPATLLFNPAGTTHRDRFCDDVGRFLSISPSADVARLLEPAAPVPLVVRDPSLAALGWRLRRALAFGADEVLESLALELVAHVGGVGERRRGPGLADWLVRARVILDEDQNDDDDGALTIGAVAARVGVHPVYLAREFRRGFGCSPGEYLRHRRLGRVRRLLAESRLSLAEIALACGFSDQSRMTHAFAAAFGCPPGRFRRQVAR